MLDRAFDYWIVGWLVGLTVAWLSHRSWDRKEIAEIKSLIAEIKSDLMNEMARHSGGG